jgi:methylmalonyl-CoA mutase
METMYQRGKIQEESLYYESRKHDGSLPIIGVNTFRADGGSRDEINEAELMRSTEDEKQAQVVGRNAFCSLHQQSSAGALRRLTEVAARQGNLFAELMDAVEVCSLGQITYALYQVGGQYRRNM